MNRGLRRSNARNRMYGTRVGRSQLSLSGIGRGQGMPVVISIVIDVVIAAVLLLIFSLYYFLLPRAAKVDTKVILPSNTVISMPSPTTSNAAGSPNPTVTGTNPQGTVQTPPATSGTMWGDKYPGKFTDGAVEKTANSYKSSHINVSVNKVQQDGVTYYVADIYVTDLKYFKTAFAEDKFGSGIHAGTNDIAQSNNAVIAINGDYCGMNAGPVVRNGTLYRDEVYKDALVMNNDGTMQTYSATDLDMNKIKNEGAYQVWTFGPMLLTNGQPMDKFNSTLNPANPRTAIGYYEPGHYCFVVVDGRQPGYSTGYTLKQMSQLFFGLGCKVAFNVDGGQSAEMSFQGSLINQPYDGGRSTSDILYIADE